MSGPESSRTELSTEMAFPLCTATEIRCRRYWWASPPQNAALFWDWGPSKSHRDKTDYPQGFNSHRHNGMTWGQAVILSKLPHLCPGGHCSCTTGGSSMIRPCQGVWGGCIPNQGHAILPGDHCHPIWPLTIWTHNTWWFQSRWYLCRCHCMVQDVVHGGVVVVAPLTLLAAETMETQLVHFNVTVLACVRTAENRT